MHLNEKLKMFPSNGYTIGFNHTVKLYNHLPKTLEKELRIKDYPLYTTK